VSLELLAAVAQENLIRAAGFPAPTGSRPPPSTLLLRHALYAPPADAARLLEVMRSHPLGRGAAVIGEVVADHPGRVVLRSLVGGERVVTMLAGEQLPRIC
jgi:hypothetical protein